MNSNNTQKKLSIIYVTNNYKPYAGGVVSSIDAFRKQLEREGHTVTVVTLDFLGIPETDRSVVRLWSPIRFKYRENYYAVPLFSDWQMQRIFTLHKPDIVHIHHPFLLGFTALCLARKQNIPVFFTYHSQYVNYVQHYISSSFVWARVLTFLVFILRWLISKRIAWVFAHVTALVVPTESIKQELTRIYTLDTLENCVVIPTGIAEIFVHKNVPVKNSGDYVDVITVSRFTSEKNLFFLLDMFFELCFRSGQKDGKTYRLTLVGFGYLEYELKKYAYEFLKLTKEQVRFILRPEKQELASLYTQASVFVFGSITETQAIVLAESMAAGTPVIALDACGARDIVISGVNGFLVRDKYEMCEKITMLVGSQKNSKLYQKLSENAFKTAEKYKISEVTQELLGQYYRAIKISKK